MLTAERLKRFAPKSRADIVQALVNGQDEIREADITTPLRLQHFLAQIWPETGGLRVLEENLRYSAARLQQVWPKRFPTLASAQPYANDPEALAFKVYNGRLGNVDPDDAWRYRGRGLLQTTGRANYRAAGYEGDPNALSRPDVALSSALKFWEDNGCNALADRDDVGALRKRINGGSNGLDEARAALVKARRIFVDAAPVRMVREEAAAPVDDGVDTPHHITDPHQVSLVQTWLRNLGYPEVGTPDGKIGPYTRATIAAYRAAKGLPPGDWIDDDLLLALAKDKEPRQVAPERAQADAATVQRVAPAARPVWCAKVWSGITAAGAAVAAFGDGVVSKISAAREYVQPVQDMLSDVPGWVWCAIVAGVAAYIWITSRRGEAEITTAVQTGAWR